MKRKCKYIIIWILVISLGSACYPGGPEYYSDLDLVTTNYDPDYWDNNSPKTYYMPDSLGIILDQEDETNNDTISITNNDLIIELVEQNMTVRNFTRLDTIDEQNQPDLVLFSQVIVVKNTSIGYIPYYPWWGGYYPWWPGYGYGYP